MRPICLLFRNSVGAEAGANGGETFRDEDIDFASRLSRAGVPVELHLWPGGVHGFTNIAPHAALSQAALAVRRDYLARHLLA